MWRDVNNDEIKYFNKIILELKNKKRFHKNIMIISYIVLILVLILSKSIKFRYLFDILEILSVNPFMWIYIYIHIKLNHISNCLSVKGYTKCIDAKILEMFPEDSSKNSNWYANIKLIDSGEIKEKIPCHNGKEINRMLTKKGLYPEVIVVDLTSKRILEKEKNNSLKEDNNTNKGIDFDCKRHDYLIYDLTNL